MGSKAEAGPEFIGNERALNAVQRARAGGSLPHAWLFTGPERVGKATLARMLAQAVNCEHQTEGLACGECKQCRRIAGGIHSDVQTVIIEFNDDGTQKKEISVDQVREVERSVALKPFEGRSRAVIIDPADRLSIGAQNAFLKTLEEPPPQVVFVLIATNEERLLPTVRSRCRRVEFQLAPAATIEQALIASGKDSDTALLLVRLARGRAGWALAAAGDASMLKKRSEMLEQASAIGAMTLADRFDVSERLWTRFKNDREAVYDRIEEWLGWWRDVMLLQSGAETAVANVDMLDELRADAARFDGQSVATFVRALSECLEHLQTNVQSRIALDRLMVYAPSALADRRVAP